MSADAVVSDQEWAVVEAEQIKAFFLETNDQNLAGAVVMSLLIYIVHAGVPLWTWLPALLCLYVVTLARAWMIRQYRRAPERYSTADWGRRQTIGGALSGVCWGFANTAMLGYVSTEYQLLIMTVITVSAASNASEGFSYPPPSRAFILLSLLPPTFWLLTIDDGIHYILALMLFVFVPLTLWQAQKRNRVFIEAQQLRFRNESLAQELACQCAVAEQASLSKGRFLAAASHDLRQPMQALAIFHDLLAQEMQTLGHASEFLANAQMAASAMNSLLDALLNVSKLDANVIEANRRAFPIQKLLDEIRRDFAPIAEQKGLALRLVPSAAWVVSDPVLLAQVLRNLVANAVRYTQKGRVLIGCRRRSGQLVLAVLDTGIGIPHDQHGAIFGEFYQVGNAARDRQQGIGLGLSIVERIARLLNHPIALDSEPGRGSCFSVSLPLTREPAIPAKPLVDREAPLLPGQSLSGLRVMIIDDEVQICQGLCSLLEGWGCAVQVANSLDAALDWVADGRPAIDMIISDMGLPGSGSGIDAIKVLRQRCGRHLPALLVTGDTSQATLQSAHEADLIMLHKPVKPARLRAAITALVAHAA